nr:cytosolic carboxypeptidase 1-like isoform X1 [Onthophagus taurus]
MARMCTDECERSVIRDCDNLFIIVKNLNVPSPRNDTESLKCLYKITMLISYKQTAKLFPIAQFSIKYLCNHPILPTLLVEIIKNSRNFKITTYSTEILFRLIIKNKLVSENERKAIRKTFWDPHNFKNILECAQTVYFFYKDTSNFHEIFTKIIKIINCCYIKKGNNQISYVTNFTVNFISDLIFEYSNQKDLFQILLPLIKNLAKNKKNINILATDQFFNSLLTQTNKLAIIVPILKLMTKTPEAIETLSRSDKIYIFILNILNTPNEKLIYKKYLMGVLYKITKTSSGIDAISKQLLWNNLLEFVTKNDKQEELKMRLILIRGITILHRGVNKITYDVKPLNIDAKLPKEYQKVDLDHSDESDNENESDEEDGCSSPKSREKSVSDEDFDFSEIDDSTSEIDDTEDDSFEDESRMEDIDGVDLTKKYFAEYFQNDSKNNGLKIFDDIKKSGKEMIDEISLRVKRNEKINRLAFPDYVGADDESDEVIDPIINHFTNDNLIRKLKKLKYEHTFLRKTVYDLDNLSENDKIDVPNVETIKEKLRNGLKVLNKVTTLRFESRFECGNLRKVEQIGWTEYNLFLSPDVNTRGGLQWFYFQISNMRPDTWYTFNVINFQKANSQFNYGMQPVFFSCLDFITNYKGWRKYGDEIIYYGNEYKTVDGKQYRSLSFKISFPFEGDYCYLAYHYPYTYTRLLMSIYPCSIIKNSIYSRVDKLSLTVNGSNEVPLITISAPLTSSHCIQERRLIFITARVHPCESNSSWIMDGIIRFLLEDNEISRAAREKYVFKIIPMLNPEGVIFGNARCGLAGEDLNRCWKKPNETLHPEVYRAKKLVEFAKRQLGGDVFAFIDVHGHSRKKFFFFYGCNARQSWNDNDKLHDDSSNTTYLLLPKLLSANRHMKPSFCRYSIERKRESTCRVVMWREFDIKRSYTLECSYCCGEDKKKITTKILRDIGVSIITSLAGLPRESDVEVKPRNGDFYC